MSALQRVPSTDILRCSMVRGRAKESVDVETAGTRRPDSELLIGAITLEPGGLGQMLCMKILVRGLSPFSFEFIPSDIEPHTVEATRPLKRSSAVQHVRGETQLKTA